jgi:hypothetical protein
MKTPQIVLPAYVEPRKPTPEIFDNIFILNHSQLPRNAITLKIMKNRNRDPQSFMVQQDISNGDVRLLIQTEKEFNAMTQKQIIQGICDQVVEDIFTEKQRDVTATVGMFTISGLAKDTKLFAHWFSKITSGMTIAEGCAVLTTNPKLLQNIQDIFPNVKVVFNKKGIANTLNGKVE